MPESPGSLYVGVGGFFAFFSAFGQSMASFGAFASGISEALVAIPHITRLRPLIAGAAELSDDRKSPGELTGTVELSRVTFRYAAGGPAKIGAFTWVFANLPEGGAHVAIFWNRANLEMVEKLRPTAVTPPKPRAPKLNRGRRQRRNHGD